MKLPASSALVALAAAAVPSASAYAPLDRRAAFSRFASGAAAAASTAAVVVGSPLPAPALEGCPADSKNCVRTRWTPPSGSSKAEAVSDVRAVLSAYPQVGQNKVDEGGWVIASDDLDGSSGAMRVEYSSSGKGFFAKAFNGGKPFVDDLKLEVEGSGAVQVRSASRIGDSDLGVNQKRLDYLSAALRAKGWST